MRSAIRGWISNHSRFNCKFWLTKANKTVPEDCQPNLTRQRKKEVQLLTEKVQNLVFQKKLLITSHLKYCQDEV